MNRLPSSVIPSYMITPYEALFDEVPEYSNLRVLGCLVFAANTSFTTDKFAATRVPCLFIGYSSKRGINYWISPSKKSSPQRMLSFMRMSIHTTQTQSPNIWPPLPVSTTTIQPKPSWDDIDTTNILTPADSSTTTSSNPSTTFDNSNIPTSPSPPHIRHSSRAHKPLAYLQQYQTYQASSSPVPLITNLAQTAVQPEFNCFMSTLTIHNDPLYYKDVVKDSGRVQAMNTKLHALENNNTGTLTTLPTNKKAIGCKWLFKTNYNLDGSVDRKKERLVVFGCN